MTGLHNWLYKCWHRNLRAMEPSWDYPNRWVYHKRHGFIGSKPFQAGSGKEIAYYPLVDLKSSLSDKTIQKGKKIGDVQNNEGIFGNLIPIPRPLPIVNDFAILTREGKGTNHDFFNQDRAILIHPFLTSPSFSKEDDNIPPQEESFFLGIFDGHGDKGHEVSEMASMKLPLILQSILKDSKEAMSKSSEGEKLSEYPMSNSYVHEALTQSFQQVNDMVSMSTYSGSTAVVCLRLSNTLYISNVGDSYLFVASYSYSTGEISIIYKNRQDKPHLPEEKERIESAGGEVTIPNGVFDDQTSRAVVKHTDSMEFYALAMSRSLGDKEVPGVIAEPIIDTIDIAPYDQKDGQRGLFVVAFTDGLFGLKGYLSIHDISQRVGRSLYGGNRDVKHQDHPILACEELIRKASGSKRSNVLYPLYRDDMTIAVKKII